MPIVFGAEPIGSIITAGTSGLPPGFLLCDGSAVSRTVYATLFAEIGTNFGYGDQATTFNLPDLRGAFVRGTDNGAGIDPDSASRVAYNAGANTGDLIGSFQPHIVGQHNHILVTPSGWGGNNGGNRPYWDSGDRATGGVASAQSDNGQGTGAETRPKNAYVNYIIKV